MSCAKQNCARTEPGSTKSRASNIFIHKFLYFRVERYGFWWNYEWRSPVFWGCGKIARNLVYNVRLQWKSIRFAQNSQVSSRTKKPVMFYRNVFTCWLECRMWTVSVKTLIFPVSIKQLCKEGSAVRDQLMLFIFSLTSMLIFVKFLKVGLTNLSPQGT